MSAQRKTHELFFANVLLAAAIAIGFMAIPHVSQVILVNENRPWGSLPQGQQTYIVAAIPCFVALSFIVWGAVGLLARNVFAMRPR